MRKVISNTTPIISLLKINQLSLLKELYEELIVPHAVWREIEAGKDSEFYADLSVLSWIDIQSIKNDSALDYLTDLDRGEAEVIILGRELKADLVIIDESLGRQYARHFNLPLTGTLGVLLRAKKENLIPKIRPLVEELRRKNVWISEHVFRNVLQLAYEE